MRDDGGISKGVGLLDRREAGLAIGLGVRRVLNVFGAIGVGLTIVSNGVLGVLGRYGVGSKLSKASNGVGLFDRS